ncbi:MAG: twin-arginine translocation signal domain-containing protein [Deltaproteobacteria bacterium]|nr:twin-arginine translocation signal domain-containing protein [Deltaproteobacteria bacterium]
MGNNQKGIHISRRGFMKTTALASIAATLPATNLVGQSTITTTVGTKPSPEGRKRNLLFSSDNPERFKTLIESIQAIKEYDFHVTPIKIDYQRLEESTTVIQDRDADILAITLPGMGISSARIGDYLDNPSIPVIVFAANPDLIMLEADAVARLRRKGINSVLANSESHFLELVKIFAAPRILEGKKALIFGRPFDSSSVPAPHLNADYIYKHTGVRLEYRPISELKPLLEMVNKSEARKEMERLKKEAVKIVEPTDEAILEACKMYVLLRSLIDREGLSAVSIDCLSFSFSQKPIVPLPCIAYTRLLDQGIAVPCEADVCMLLSSLIMQKISEKPSFFHNVSEVDTKKSVAILRHCVAPIRLLGADAEPLPFNLRDYHGFGRDIVPEVEFPVGVEVTMGGFSKDLNNFVIWPGRIQPGIHDMETPSFQNVPENAPATMKNMRRFCSNRAEVKIRYVDRFLQSIAGIHQVMVAGIYTNAIYEAMARMNVSVIAPPDMRPPEA